VTINRLLTKPITLRYAVAGGVDRYGQPLISVVDRPAKGYYQLARQDDMDDVSRDQIDFKEFLPASVNPTDLKSVVINGEELQVDGPPHKQYNPRVSADVYWLVPVRRAT
jgi:hypothetical protein